MSYQNDIDEVARAQAYGIHDDDIIEAAAIAIAESRQLDDYDMWSGTDKVDIHIDDCDELGDGAVTWEAYPVLSTSHGLKTDVSAMLAIGWVSHFP